jgi:hypothetical protein
MDSFCKSPYQITLGPFISIVPKITGIGLPSSAVGTWKSDNEAAIGGKGWGCIIIDITIAVTDNMIAMIASIMRVSIPNI